MTKFGYFFKTEGTRGSSKNKHFDKSQMFYAGRLAKTRAEMFPIIRLSFLILLSTAAFFTIVSRLIYLQIFKGQEYQKIAEGNRVLLKRKLATRGIIFDRYGKALVANSPKFVIRKDNKVEEISKEEALKLEAENLPEFNNVEVLSTRNYLMPKEMSHVLGYLGEVSEKELKTNKYLTYKPGDLIGRSGVEESYEDKLKGKNGEEYYEINSQGVVLDKLGEKPGVPGTSIKLTIDSDLQKTAYDALENASKDPRYQGVSQVKGTVIVSSVGSGEILAMVSLPTYDSTKLGNFVNDTKNYPLMNRAISATYPPGSTFKLVVSTAGLESGRIKSNTLIEDTGVIRVGKWEYPTWSSTGDGMVDIVKGIRRSNDIFFYRVGEMTGLTNIIKYAKKYSLGEKLGVDLPSEAEGNLPSDEWKFKVTGEHWYLGDTYHLAIGQGYILTTPLQVNMWTNAVASRGKLYRPHVVLDSGKPVNQYISKSVNRYTGNTDLPIYRSTEIPKNNDYLIRDLHLKKETVDLIWKGMKEACQTGGTGWPLFDFKIPTACKTGTAEFGEQSTTHAWFTVFAPADKPEIAVTVLIENGGQGSDVAAPVARKILEKYFGVK